MADSNASEKDYSKLTVPQLKARCKELRITGYSKLGKAALLEKLSQHVASRNNPPGAPPQPTATKVGGNPAAPSDSQADLAGDSQPPNTLPVVSTASPPGASLVTASTSGSNVPSPALNSPVIRSVPTITSPRGPTTLPSQVGLEQGKTKKPAGVKKRPGDSANEALSASQKKRKLTKKASISRDSENNVPVSHPEQVPTKSNIMPLAHRPLTPANNVLNKYGFSNQDLSYVPPVLAQRSISRLSSSSKPTTGNRSTRFRPLALRPKGTKKILKIADSMSTSTNQNSLVRLSYLDFSSTPSLPRPSSFQPITIPPSISERKRIKAWSVILSGLSDAERRECAFVSRAIRYAVYLSAIPITDRTFGARRLVHLPQQYNMSMTNFWPYLKLLRLELSNRLAAYGNSFVAGFFGSHMPIAEDIWGCPENDKQLTVALRFLMTRVWFALSLNNRDIEKTKGSVVVDAHEIVKDEIWSITVVTKATARLKTALETFYVLEPTCEVIGLPPRANNPISTLEASGPSTSALGKGLCLRVDWSSYVQHHISNSDESEGQPPLLSFLKSTNTEEYAKGISKLWLMRISKEGKVGEYKRIVADRYVLACVAGNSVSGQWMSSTHMAQVFAGTASESDLTRTSLLRKENPKVNLFLPEHHLVESVHFTTSGTNAKSLHPALATIQTPGREYFILRDNGMEVGCEEDGVWPVWMELLGCDARGVAQ